ncbi:MAG: radical SAM protein [Anaerovoracaceae bacterium]
MRYEGDIYRPPSEARSLIIQVTIGCTHNQCTFCTMCKDKVFRIRDEKEVVEDLLMARKYYSHVGKIFFCDGDALCLSNERLLYLLHKVEEIFPECQSVNVYGTPKDILLKTPEELVALREAGVKIIYIGAESGNPQVLKNIKKGATREEIIGATKKVEESGIAASVTFISGMGGKDLWKEHAIDSGTMISEMNASYVSLLTLMVPYGAPIGEEIEAGTFELLSPEEVVVETILMMENMNVSGNTVFRSNHASNYVSLRGNLPADKERMLAQLRVAEQNTGILKDERFRML